MIRFVIGCIMAMVVLYMFTQMWFWFNPQPKPFWFFTIFNQTSVQDGNDQLVKDRDFSESLKEWREQRYR